MRTIPINIFNEASLNRIESLTQNFDAKAANNVKEELKSMKNLATNLYGAYARKMDNGDVAILGNAGVYRGAGRPIYVNKLILFKPDGTVKEKFSMLDHLNENRVFTSAKTLIKNGIQKFNKRIRKYYKHLYWENKTPELYAVEKSVTTPEKKDEYLWVKNNLDGMTVERGCGRISTWYQDCEKKILSDGSREYRHTEVF